MRSGLRGISRNVLLLGLVSLFGDISSEMVVPLLPAFLIALGGGAEALGIIEGVAEATASLFKYLSGRCVDRVGKGIRTSPRDKLLAGSADPDHLAEAYSFHRGMDHLGAAIGPLLAAALLLLWPGRLRLVFALAAIPGALAVALLFAVREMETHRLAPRGSSLAEDAVAVRASSPEAVSASPASQVPPRLLGAIFVFTLGNSTDALVLLPAHGLGIATAVLPALWTVLHVVRAATSWQLGRLADRLGRRAALAAGWAWYAACYVGFALASARWHAWALFAAYGLVAGLTEGTERALVASSVPQGKRGRALGLYNLVSGCGLLVASVMAGEVWDHVSPAAALGLGAALAAMAALLLLAQPGAPQPA